MAVGAVLAFQVGPASTYTPPSLPPSSQRFLHKANGLFDRIWDGLMLHTAAASSVEGDSVAAIQGKLFPSLMDADLEDLIRGLETGLFTSVDLVGTYVARIMEVNSTLHAVTELNPDALAIAADLDLARAKGNVLGPLHGIPILIKNNIATADKMNNTAGSYALLGATVPTDSTVAAKLRKAGAVILGKTNLSQWANFRGLNTTNGWSSHGGQTTAAYYPGQDPSGSSSGSGVASSLGLAWASLGTETDGSILDPSNRQNLVGIKPTVGLTSRYLVIPISEHQDTVGPMARTVKDAAHLLSAIAGPDPNDNYTSAIPFPDGKIPDYAAACDFFALRGARIGVPRVLITTSDQPDIDPVVAAFDAALDILRATGATIVEDIPFSGLEALETGGFELVTLRTDIIRGMAKYLAQLTSNPHGITSLAELLSFTHESPPEAWPVYGTEHWDIALSLVADPRAAEWAWSNLTMQRYLGGLLGLTGALQNHSLDALVVPTAVAYAAAAVIGAPAITVPLGSYPAGMPTRESPLGHKLTWTAPGVPFGMSFLGRHWDEERLVGLAYAFEQRTRVREEVKPYLRPMVEVGDVVRLREQGGLYHGANLGVKV